ncbi:hypothetical protein GLE_5448 [Lysobacter enzymogenes]|uniref:Uncharacterized protein n=1 Tax=Lysobacter enzymogenes TaxID=69 RepID=A0A0S2DQM4_LYSEN|nr:hypothetical protein GLE_5448 [Lysobacter enzymogenes]
MILPARFSRVPEQERARAGRAATKELHPCAHCLPSPWAC